MLLDVREPWELDICHHGIRSRLVALYLERQGSTRVINLQGGVDAWAQQVDPEMAIY